jgi:hypothetical protein
MSPGQFVNFLELFGDSFLQATGAFIRDRGFLQSGQLNVHRPFRLRHAGFSQGRSWPRSRRWGRNRRAKGGRLWSLNDDRSDGWRNGRRRSDQGRLATQQAAQCFLPIAGRHRRRRRRGRRRSTLRRGRRGRFHRQRSCAFCLLPLLKPFIDGRADNNRQHNPKGVNGGAQRRRCPGEVSSQDGGSSKHRLFRSSLGGSGQLPGGLVCDPAAAPAPPAPAMLSRMPVSDWMFFIR